MNLDFKKIPKRPAWRQVRPLGFKFKILYKPGLLHKEREALSGLPTETFDDAEIDDKISTICVEQCTGLSAIEINLLTVEWKQYLVFTNATESRRWQHCSIPTFQPHYSSFWRKEKSHSAATWSMRLTMAEFSLKLMGTENYARGFHLKVR